MDKQINFTRTSPTVRQGAYFPNPLRRWFIQLAHRMQMQEKCVSGAVQKGGSSGSK